MKRGILLMLCAVLMLSSAVTAVDVGRADIGGVTAATVTVPLGEGVSTDIILAQGSVNRTQDAREMLVNAAKQGSLVVTFSGGLFQTNYMKTKLDGYGPVPRCQANLVRNGMAVNGCASGQTAVYLGFTRDGRAMIDEVGVTFCVSYGSKKVTTWGVNEYRPDDRATLFFTPEAGYDLPLYTGAVAAKIVNREVTEIVSSGMLRCMPDTCYLVCGSAVLNRLPEVGTHVDYSTEFSKSEWEDVVTAVSCGPWLLKNGSSALSFNGKWSALFDQSADASAGRTFAAVMSDGSLVLGTCTASPRQIAVYLSSIGARDAMLLDGGASSMLSIGTGFLAEPGRELNHIVAIYSGEKTEVQLSDARSGAAVKIVPSRQKLIVNGAERTTEIYNIDGSNYFKLRDVAMLLKETGSRFSVSFDGHSNRVVVMTGVSYASGGGELKEVSAEEMRERAATAVASPQVIEIDGKTADLKAYNIGGSNFFGLRALGRALNFDVDYDAVAGAMVITTK